MYKNKLRIAIEGGEPIWEGDRGRKAGDAIERHKEKLKLCPKCRVVWEWVAETGYVKNHPEYYPVLPRYGKPETVCPKCLIKGEVK